MSKIISLIHLLVELHLLVLEWLNLYDVFAFGLTCQHFWALALRVIHQTRHLGSWAGKSIVCLPDSSKAGQLPPLLTEESDHLYCVNSGISLYMLATETYNCVSSHCWQCHWLLEFALR